MLLAQESIFFRWRMKELTRKIHSFFITFFIYVGSHGISCSSFRFRPSKKLETRSLCKFVDFLSFDLFHMSFYLKIRKKSFFLLIHDTKWCMYFFKDETVNMLGKYILCMNKLEENGKQRSYWEKYFGVIVFLKNNFV